MTEYHNKRPMRIVLVAPGSLVEQWREELFEKFGFEFLVFTRELQAATPSGNPFDSEPGWGVSSINYNIQDLLVLAGGNQ
jgi:hypothetical protein